VRAPRAEAPQALHGRRGAPARPAALAWHYPASLAGAAAVWRRASAAVGGDEAAAAGAAWPVGERVWGGPAALAGSPSRGRVGPAAGLRGGLARGAMVVGLCPRAEEAEHRVGAAVCLEGHRAVGRGHAGAAAAVAPRRASSRLAAAGGVAPSRTLGVEASQGQDHLAAPGTCVVCPPRPPSEAQVRRGLSQCVLTSARQHTLKIPAVELFAPIDD